MFDNEKSELRWQKRKYFRAKKGVILAAGAIYSPIILERSGVGDPDVLSNLDIPVVLENTMVGRNLQDHLMTQMDMFQKYNKNNAYATLNSGVRFWEQWRYILTREGMYANTAITSAFYFEVMGSTGANVQIMIQEHPYVGYEWNLYGSAMRAFVTCLDTKSRGEVHYSGDPNNLVGNAFFGIPGTVNGNYASEEDDLMCLIKGLQKAREIFNATDIMLGTFKKVGVWNTRQWKSSL